MLENRIKSLVWTIRLCFILGIPFWIALTIYACNDGQNIAAKSITGIIIGVITIGYAVLRYIVELQAAKSYLNALQSKAFQQALTLGRSYYGLRRSGLKGAAGTYLTMYDEQAINNDINAYSK